MTPVVVEGQAAVFFVVHLRSMRRQSQVLEVEHEHVDRSRYLELQRLRAELRCGQCVRLEGAVAV